MARIDISGKELVHVIVLDNGQQIAAKEKVFPKTVSYICNDMPERTIMRTERKEVRFPEKWNLNILNEDSFGLLVKYNDPGIDYSKPRKTMYIKTEDFDDFIRILKKSRGYYHDYRVYCPTLEHLSNVYEISLLKNNREDIEKIRCLCWQLYKMDKTQEGFITTILNNCDNGISHESSRDYIEKLSDLISSYEKEEICDEQDSCIFAFGK